MIDINRFDIDRFVIASPRLTPPEIASLIDQLEIMSDAPQQERRGGIRDVTDDLPEMGALADHISVRSIVNSILGPHSFVVRSTLFDKTEAANWKVPWHQDLTIAVRERREVAGYGPWSTKARVVHVQPPSEVLERMVTIRIHLDPCPRSNGALRVLSGTHRLGRLNQNHIEGHVDEARAVTCEVEAGGALIMRPLLLHASSASGLPGHRRVIHFDFATGELAGGLVWRMR